MACPGVEESEFNFVSEARLLRCAHYAEAVFVSTASLETKIGGAERDRTVDLLHAMQALFQLSYGPRKGEERRLSSGLRQLESNFSRSSFFGLRRSAEPYHGFALMVTLNDRAVLAFEDGSVFEGFAFGAKRTVVGEGVFNTSMTGYQEILTDPSYLGQIITMTTPMIGNYGVNLEDVESNGPKATGFVCRELSPIVSNWRSSMPLGDYLAEHDIPGISGVDTRAITKLIRVHGALKACLSTEGISAEEAVEKAKNWEGLVGVDYVKEVTTKEIYTYDPGEEIEPFTVPGTQLEGSPERTERFPIVAFDMGVKTNILRKLARHGFDVTVVPADTPAAKVRELNPKGVFISNGPGDPSAVTYAHKTIAELMPDYPMFGICMGHQVITHALGAETMKLPFGHRGGNQPVKNIETGVVSITAQNHGFASTKEALEGCGAVVTEYNLNDQTVAGIRHKDLPVFSVQYHPEASPGPHDSDPLFAHFYDLVAGAAEA
tara:strand:+ start:3634 stop:5106 length:1473 start_codon:yes stop_codon:yes gene_type:complete